MPYVTKYKNVTKTNDLGYDEINIHRPKFIYFEFTGLRPGIPHWVFFGGIEVTKFCNTSYSKTDYRSASGTSVLKAPGEKFVSASQFPSDSGLAYSGPTAQGGSSAPLYSSSNGVLKGVFYLQSNSDFSWPLSATGKELLAIDISSPNKDQSYSYGAALFKGLGQYQNYYETTAREAYKEWVDPPRDHNDGGNDDNFTGFKTTSNFDGTKWSYTTTSYVGGNAASSTTSVSTASNQSGGFLGSLKEIFSPREVTKPWS